MAKTEPQGLGKKIRDARTDAGLTQQQLASKVGTARRRVIAWEGGENEPSVHYLRRIAETTGATTEQLLDETDDEEAAAAMQGSHAEMIEALRPVARLLMPLLRDEMERAL